MNDYSDIIERFQSETAVHEMTVLHDEGVYRHLRFKAPGTGSYVFDLVTWPGTLAVRGDVDGYMFTRVTDMFEFFRSGIRPDGSIQINPGYWSEKVEGGESVTTTYSEDRFRDLVTEHFVDAVRYGGAPRGLGKAVRLDVLDADESAYEDGARQILRDFEFGQIYEAKCLNCPTLARPKRSGLQKNRGDARGWELTHKKEFPGHVCHIFTQPAFTFANADEWDLRDFDWSFLWCCYAICWGIARYDAGKAATRPVEAVTVSAGGVL